MVNSHPAGVGRPKGSGTTMGNAATKGTKRGKEKASKAPASELYEIGSKVLCHASFEPNTGSAFARPAEIIEQKVDASGVSYYVHYSDVDKRLDEWVREDRIVGEIDDEDELLAGSTDKLDESRQNMTRRLKRRYNAANHMGEDVHDLAPADQQLEQEHQEKTKVKNIQSVDLGRYEIFTWYYSPYPEEFNHLDKLYCCEFCLKYFRKKKTFVRHGEKCEYRHPPGDEIYRSPPKRPGQPPDPDVGIVDPTIAVFEVDGSKHKIYCQSLCLLSKLFLDHKTLYYDVDQFLFYVLCEEIGGVYHIVGYFSKEKHSLVDNNLACILVLPPYQKKGYGGFQMQFSYELSKKEGKSGGPERPLSDLGKVAYRGYWQRVLLSLIHKNSALSMKDLTDMTAIKQSDVHEVLDNLDLLKYWRGEHVIAPHGRIIEDILESLERKKSIAVDVSRLHWTPFSSIQPTLPSN